LDARKYCL
jgi:hypothetical protein